MLLNFKTYFGYDNVDKYKLNTHIVINTHKNN